MQVLDTGPNSLNPAEKNPTLKAPVAFCLTFLRQYQLLHHSGPYPASSGQAMHSVSVGTI